MPNPYVNKVQLADGTSLIDISDTTATASDVLNSKYFYNAAGAKVQGTATGSTAAISVVDELDANGGTIRTITALDISDTTAVAADVASGKYFYTANGTKTAGTYSGAYSGPTLTITLNSNDGLVSSITCDKTISECYTYYESQQDDAITKILILVSDGSQTVAQWETCADAYVYHNGESSDNIYWYIEAGGAWHMMAGLPDIGVQYDSNGITYEYSPTIPTFVLIYDSNWTTLQGVRCSNTYAECVNFLNNGRWLAIAVRYNGSSYRSKMSASVFFNNSTISYYIELNTEGVAEIKIDYASNGTLTATANPIPFRTSSNLTASTLTVTAPSGYYASNATKTLTDANLTAGNIKKDVSIFGVTGTYEGNISTTVVIPEQTVTASSTYTQLTYTDGLVAGEQYICTINGTSKTLTALSQGSVVLAYDGANLLIDYDNGMYLDIFDSSLYDSYTVKVEKIDSGLNLQAKTNISPTESSQTIEADSGYDGLSSVQINAISSSYVGSGITRRSSSDLTASTLTVTAPSGYYASNATKTLTDANLTAGNIKDGVSIFGVTGTYTGSGGIDCPTFTVTFDSGWATVQNVTCDKTFAECNSYREDGILNAVVIITNGSSSTELGASNNSVGGTLYYYANYGSDVTSILIQYTSNSLTATLNPVPQRDSTDLTVSGATVTAPAGYYENSASKSVASGSVTAPSTISGSSATVSTGTNTITLSKTVSVTPTVSTAGYVSSGTAGNSSVSLTASVTTKGAATITPTTSNQTIASGTYLTGTQTISGDANLVAGNIISGKSIFGVSGSVVIQHYYTGTGVPSSSLGVDGDIYLKTT